MKIKGFPSCIAVVLLIASIAGAQHQYQTDLTADDFRKRRQAVYDAIDPNIEVIQGAEDVQGFIVLRQSNTFYYLSGLEVASAYMVVDGRSRTTTLYSPHRDAEREASGGAIILAAGTKGKRFALPHSQVMLHQPWGGISGQAADIKIQAETIMKTKKMLNEVLAKHTGQTAEKIAAEIERDRYMTADEAQKYGLVDEVLHDDDADGDDDKKKKEDSKT